MVARPRSRWPLVQMPRPAAARALVPCSLLLFGALSACTSAGTSKSLPGELAEPEALAQGPSEPPVGMPLPSAGLAELELPNTQVPSAEPTVTSPVNQVPLPSTVSGPLEARRGLAGRLSPRQYGNVIGDLLGVTLGVELEAAAGASIPRARNSTGLFTNAADGQPASDEYALAFGKLAPLVAARADLELLAEGASDCVEDAASCLDSFIATAGLKLMRRPLSEREQQTFLELAEAVLAEGLSLEQSQRALVEAFLQSPHFLFRMERETEGNAGTPRSLSGFELASRLAFFIWESAPDSELLEVAASGSLDGTDAGLPTLRAQAARMLGEPKAQRLVRGFITDLAETEAAAFKGMTEELKFALAESLRATVEAELLGHGGTLVGLFTTQRYLLTPAAASHLGLQPEGPGATPYDVSALRDRVGIFSHPGFIAGFGEAETGSLITRGVSLMVKLLCRQPLAPPEGLADSIQRFAADNATGSQREQSEARQRLALPVEQGGAGDASCWACHGQFEPLAYAFSRLDAAGRFVGETDAAGRPLAVDGWITADLSVPETQRSRYADLEGLMTLLAGSEVAQRCMAEHFISYATGRAAEHAEKQNSVAVHRQLAAAGGTLPAVVEAVVSSPIFRMQMPEGS